jgi:hypothetical protein
MTGPNRPLDGGTLGRVTGNIAKVGLAESDVRMLGRQFLFSLYAAMRNLRIYPVDNPTVQKSIEELSKTANELVSRDGEGEFRVAGEFLFLNATRMKLDMDNYESFSFVIARFRESDIERLGFRQLPDPADWAVLLTCLLDPVGPPATMRSAMPLRSTGSPRFGCAHSNRLPRRWTTRRSSARARVVFTSRPWSRLWMCSGPLAMRTPRT